jgi:hypothetical protein
LAKPWFYNTGFKKYGALETAAYSKEEIEKPKG